MPELKYYRIGDFAKKLGVTPDLLKYCEQKRLISSVKQENGYRYYDFTQSATVYEYLKLKNQGFSAEEIFDLLHAPSFQTLAARSAAREQDLEKQLNFTRALLRYTRELAEKQEIFSTPPNWYLMKHNAFFFLPHSLGDTLTDDDTHLEQVTQWIEWMPIVCSVSTRGLLNDAESPVTWGLAVDEDFARQQGLSTEEPVQYIPARLCLEVFVTEDLEDRSQRELYHAGQSLLDKLDLRQTDVAFQFVLAKMWGEESRKGYSVLSIPVDSLHIDCCQQKLK